MVRGYLSDELRCARLADVVVSISDWEARHYWPLLAGSRRTVTAPYFVPAEIDRTAAPAGPPGGRAHRVVALSSADPGPLVLHALETFKTLVAATAERLPGWRSEEHTSELQSLMRISYAVFCLKKKKKNTH